MLRFLLTLLVLAVSALAAEKETTPPVFPSEIKLTSGATLRNTSAIRWTSDSVVVKHVGGADPIRFANIAEPYRAQVLAVKNATAKAAASATQAKANSAARVYHGQVFVTTRGAGAYKFTGTTVYAYPLAVLDQVKSSVRVAGPLRGSQDARQWIKAWVDALKSHAPLAIDTTDAEGKFSISVSSPVEVFLFCTAGRLTGRMREDNIWAVPASDNAPTLLTGSNCETFETDTRAP